VAVPKTCSDTGFNTVANLGFAAYNAWYMQTMSRRMYTSSEIRMKSFNSSQSPTCLAFSIIAVLLLSACSSSGDSTGEQGDNNVSQTPTADGPNSIVLPNDDDNTSGETDEAATSTLVTFDITVPVYVSQALQVRVDWDTDNTMASWVVDESWTATGNLQTDSSYAVTVTFFDDNGAIVLGRANTTLTTTTRSTQTLEILASQFDTSSADDDSDGVSNLDELLAGANPIQATATDDDEAPPPVDASIELIADKTFRIQWQPVPAANYYRILENVDGSSGYEPISGELGATVDHFDHRVALYRRVNARYIVEACNTSGCSFSVQQLIESLEGNLEEAVGYIKSDNPHERNSFGSALSLSADGQTLAVGETGSRVAENNTAQNGGTVHVFQRSNGQWIAQQRLIISAGDDGDAFGSSLELSADGNTLVVGAPGEDSTATGVNGNQADNSSDSSGAAYVFVRSNNQWLQQAYLKASNTPTVEVPSIGFNDRFGGAVAISADGRTIVVGATGEDSGATGINGDESDNSGLYTGAAYVFVVNNGVWSQQAYLKASTRNGLRAFGHSVSLNADGNTLAVSAYNPFTPPSTPTRSSVTTRGANYNTFFGAVYIFTRGNSTWQQQALLRPSDNEGGWHLFGDPIDLSDDGNTLVAYGNSGVYVLERQSSNWKVTQHLVQSNPGSDSNWYGSPNFGTTLSISGDGSTVASSWQEESSASTGIQGDQGAEISIRNSGAAYVFEKEAGSWQQSAYIKAPNSRESLEFGNAISLDHSGDTLAISAENESSNGIGIQGDQSDSSLFGAGAVYLY